MTTSIYPPEVEDDPSQDDEQSPPLPEVEDDPSQDDEQPPARGAGDDDEGGDGQPVAAA